MASIYCSTRVGEQHTSSNFERKRSRSQVRHVVSGLVLPKDHKTLESFLAASQRAWDEVWDKIH